MTKAQPVLFRRGVARKHRGVALLLLTFLTGCAAPAAPDTAPAGPPAASIDPLAPRSGERTPTSATAPPGVASELAKASNAFGFDLFRGLTKAAKGNVVVSPLSVYTALTMTYSGAAGSTKDAMAKALALAGTEPANVDRQNQELLAALRSSDPGTTLEIANAVFPRIGLGVKPKFGQRMTASYDAHIEELDFTSPSAAHHVNDWVSEKTHAKIPTIVDGFDPATILFLANAVYFKGAWQDKFRPELTRTLPFALTDGGTKQVPLMFRTSRMAWLETPTFKAAALPYANGRTSMYVFLPDKSSNTQSLSAELGAISWESVVSRFQPAEVQIGLPRFKAEYIAELSPPLAAMGMGLAFSGQADFSEMLSVQAHITTVLHKTFIEVNEEGTEAAAVTGAAIAAASRAVSELVLDRPFLLAIADQTTGALLFVGAIVEP
jgi:serine protease inhibitor